MAKAQVIGNNSNTNSGIVVEAINAGHTLGGFVLKHSKTPRISSMRSITTCEKNDT